MKLAFSRSAFRQLSRLDKRVQRRVVLKLEFFLLQKDPLQWAEKISDNRFGEWRFRIGDYRVLFDANRESIIILGIGHRKDIYR